MNNLKKTIMTFVAVISSVSAVTAMANEDIAGELEKWYQTSFHKSYEVTSQVNENGLKDIEESTKKQQVDLLKEVASTIESFSQNTIGQSKSDIENYHENYQNRLTKAKTNLQGSNFNEFTKKEKAKLDSEISEEVEGMLSEVLGD